MSDLKKKIDDLIDSELDELKVKKQNLTSEIESLTKRCDELKRDTEKEIAQKKVECEVKCNEDITKVNKLLKEAEEKLNTATKREEESLIIEKQIKELDKKTKAFKDTEKEIEVLKSSYLEKEKQAELIIEQYNKKIEELEKANKKK